jgi:hypothetical protein
MNELVQIAPECPVCRAHHTQNFTRDTLRELVKQHVLELYCPNFDKRWPAAAEQREILLHAVGGDERKPEEAAAGA